LTKILLLIVSVFLKNAQKVYKNFYSTLKIIIEIINFVFRYSFDTNLQLNFYAAFLQI